MSPKKKQLWIASANVKQQYRNGVLGDTDEAFVNVIALAVDKSDFRRQTKKEVESLDLTLLRLKDVEPLKLRLSKHSIHEELAKLAQDVARTGQLAFDVFCTYKSDT